jgi:hypothetical protein
MPTESPRWNSTPNTRSPASPAEPEKDTGRTQLPLTRPSQNVRETAAEITGPSRHLGKRPCESAGEETGSPSRTNTTKKEDQPPSPKKLLQEVEMGSEMPRGTPRVRHKVSRGADWIDTNTLQFDDNGVLISFE